MRYNPKSLMLIFCLFQLPADCQQSEPTRIVYRSEAEQRRFVEEYLKRGLPLGRLEVIGIMTEAIGELDILTRVQPWVVPLLEKTVQELSTNSVANKIQIDRIMRCIARSGRQTGLDTIIRLFGNHPDGPHWVQEFIYNSLDHPNYVSLWYNALDSPNKMVKEEAEKCMPILIKDRGARRDRDWADAAVDRYHRAPTEEDIMNDPIHGLSRASDLKVEQILHLKALGEAEVERRRKGGKPGHPVGR